MRSIVVAYDRNRGIGSGGRPPWLEGELPADAQHFRSVTAKSSVIMGRSSYETFRGVLPGRQNIVVTTRNRLSQGVTMVKTLEEAYDIAEYKDINIIGGASIYRLAVDTVNRIYATEVDFSFSGVDTFFPVIDHTIWHEISREHHDADGLNRYGYSFVIYERVIPRA